MLDSLLALTKVQVTESKIHDSRFRGITQEPNILYLFGLAYLAFYRFKQIIEAGRLLCLPTEKLL